MNNYNVFSLMILGDISKQKQLRSDLKCKSFKWFMEEIAFDQDAHYPAIVPPDFASGFIKSDADPDLCVDSNLRSKYVPFSNDA